MKNQQLMLTALFLVLGAVLVTGLVVVPAIEGIDLLQKVEAKNSKPKNPNHKTGHSQHHS